MIPCAQPPNKVLANKTKDTDWHDNEFRNKEGKNKKKTITHMDFPNQSCLLHQMTSDIRNLEERDGLWVGGRVREVRERDREGGG